MNKKIKLSTGLCSYYDSGGNKKPFVIINGFSLREGYIPFIKLLEKKSRIIIPDLPFATNYYFSREHTVDNYTNFLLELIAKLKLKEVNICGNSLGGCLALSCVLNNSKLVHKLVVRAPFYTRDLLPFQLRNSFLLALYKSLAYKSVTLKFVSKLFYSKMGRLSAANNNNLWEKIKSKLNEIDNKKARNFIFDLLSINFKPELRNIKNQVLILWPGQDKLLNPNGADYLHKNLINSELITEPDSRHCIATVNPKVLTCRITTFLNK